MRTFSLILLLLIGAAGCSAASNESEGSGGGAAASAGNGGGIGVGGSGNAGGSGGSGAGINTGGNGGGGGSGNACAGVSQQANNTVLPADVIWTIDTSCSMTEETAAVRANMNAFSKQIANAGIDIRIVLIAEQYAPPPIPLPGVPDEGICIDAPLGSGLCPADTNPPAFAHIYQTVNSTDSLDKIISTYPTWKTVLRPNSLKIFTVVTDDNSAMPAKTFTDSVNALDPVVIKPNSWKVYGIYCFSDCPSAATPGTVYQELVTQTGGVAGDLCLQNFKPVFDKLAAGIVGSAKLDCAWTIPPPPAGETFNKNKVNVIFTPGGGGAQPPIGKVGSKADCGAQGGWYYDDENNPTSVLLCDDTCQSIQSDPNGKIDIQFGCDTVQVPR